MGYVAQDGNQPLAPFAVNADRDLVVGDWCAPNIAEAMSGEADADACSAKVAMDDECCPLCTGCMSKATRSVVRSR